MLKQCPGTLTALLIFALALVSAPAMAWSNHAPGSALALGVMPELAEVQVKVEPLEDFLRAQAPALEAHLAEQARFARGHFPQVPEAPASLHFGADAADLRTAFLQALRLNPEIKLAAFVQSLPGQADTEGLPQLGAGDVVIFNDLDAWQAWQFFALRTGQNVSALSVLASAADEPDYGHDIHLFSDNPSAVASLYHFGLQPFGDSRFEHSSQAPFHMGYFHESAIIFTLGSFLKNTFADWRAYQFFSLAQFAFEAGHPYWGYRFMGWGLHYVQDLTQPYHATVLPGSGTADLLWIYAKDSLGFSHSKQTVIARNADFHTYIETLQYQRLALLLASQELEHPLVQAYRINTSERDYPPYDSSYLRTVIAAEARQSADQLDALIALNQVQFPAAPQLLEQSPLQTLLVQLTERFGVHSRHAVRAVLTEASQAEE
ncbi:hypothetical protein QWY82_11255 [Simiduia curdlanivorans]|uniref:Phospholipase n=1 Tax=Simiduia curdlanivorans TaxID=1492769 RepID=A0ABV8VAM4_9GAMM|nr:hypothetical protein [Simiduia curdlanivorans]MDN3639382.1 hypothetical protein [Simiduia curdlanivorans]